jgi:hypothetical protein
MDAALAIGRVGINRRHDVANERQFTILALRARSILGFHSGGRTACAQAYLPGTIRSNSPEPLR